MSRRSTDLRTGWRLVGIGLVLTLVVLLASSGTLAAGAMADTESVSATGTATDESPHLATGATDGTEPAIDPALENATGEVRVVVQFDDLERDEIPDGEAAIETRQAHANASQEPLERHASETSGVTFERGFWITNAAVVTVDRERADVTELATIDGVSGLYADTEVVASSGTVDGATTAATADAGEEYTEGLETINVPQAWDEFDTRGEGATVVVLDSGVDGDHPDLEVEGWKDFSSTPSDEPVDYDSHGTHVSGIVAGGNASGTQIGVAPEATLVHGAVITDCDEECRGRQSTVLEGIEWAIDQDADVISTSFGWDDYLPSMVQAVENANDAGTVVVAGVGNGGEGTSIAPGNVYDAVGVGASSKTDSVIGFSAGEEIDTADAWGRHALDSWPDSYVAPDVVAPGVGVKGPVPGGDYASRSGTSKATPHVAGTVALMQSATDEELTPDEIQRALRETAWKPDGEPDEPDTRYGHGIIDTRAAIDAVGDHSSVEGTVNDAVTEEPLAEATVEIVAEDGTVAEIETDEDGTFDRFGLAGDEEYTVVVAKEGYETIEETAFVPTDERVMIDVVAAGDGELEVTLRDTHFDAGIEDGTVSLNGSRGIYPGTTLENGTYVVSDVPTDEHYTLEASSDGYEDETRRVAVEDDAATRTVAMTGDATLEVTVESEEEGDPIENASVVLERGDGESYEAANLTDESGQLTVVIPGTGEPYTVEASAPEFASTAVESEPIESEATESVTVVLSEPLLPIPGFGPAAAVIALAAFTLLAMRVDRRD
ncbi:S8 family serine peptidase [Natronobacterium texcoconense]|uniref:Serine protease, subtilisin family n=1 Tax=Natronobacterium texcoconense TaxID=1095778 RepID=A0A1H1IFN6_NATTX|nr:S8 family serine peptidase [Natronobacterium texcoconense]SDR36481.1 Serine protease, subtilisin family [Natronobacterium texcoconense]